MLLRPVCLTVTLAVGLNAVGTTAPAWAHGDLHAQIQQVTADLDRELAKPVDGHERANIYLARGELYRVHREWANAVADYDQAAHYEPDWDAVDLARGKLLLESGDLPRAHAVFAKFLVTHVDHPEALLLYAEVLVGLGRGIEAVRRFDQAIKRHPQPEPDHYLARVSILESLGRRYLPRALRGLDEGLRRLGPIVSLEERAIQIELVLGRHDQALARIERQSRASERKDLWLARKADVLERAGRHRQAGATRQSALAAIAALPPHLQSRKSTGELKQQLLAARPR